MNNKFIDMTGQRFGKLVVEKRAEQKSPQGALWVCKCDCGNTKVVLGGQLRSGNAKSCGCLEKRNRTLVGKRFGKLVVLKKAGIHISKGGQRSAEYECQCDCGRRKIVAGSALQSGATKSCGCMSSNLLDIVGKRFGNYTVLARAKNRYGKAYLLCECDCGTVKEVMAQSLYEGRVVSCGCHKNKQCGDNFRTHGLSKTRLYHVWEKMRARCYCETDDKYTIYGGRGIKMCDEWDNDFRAFHDWAYANGYDETAPKGECTIDRIDVNGDYEPSNCRFINNLEQSYNKRNTIKIAYEGEEHTIKEWSEITGLSCALIRDRYKKGKSSSEILDTKIGRQKQV